MRISKFCILFFCSVLISCSDDKYEVESDYLISKIYGLDKKLIANYAYNEKNQLVRRDFYNVTANNAYIYDTYLYYPNGLVKRIINNDVTFGGKYYYDFFYDKGKVIEFRSYANERLFSMINFIYNKNGELTHYLEDKKVRAKFDYLNKNAIKETRYYVDEYTGESHSWTEEYEYDTKKQPLDGLNYLPRRNILAGELIPKYASFAESISKNNLLKSNRSEYSYKYNQFDLPIEITHIFDTLFNFTVVIEYQERN